MGILERLFGTHHQGGHHGTRTHDRGPSQPVTVSAICPGCHASIASSARFCPQCGSAVLPKTCKHCNSSQPAGARFCGQCGQLAS